MRYGDPSYASFSTLSDTTESAFELDLDDDGANFFYFDISSRFLNAETWSESFSSIS